MTQSPCYENSRTLVYRRWKAYTCGKCSAPVLQQHARLKHIFSQTRPNCTQSPASTDFYFIYSLRRYTTCGEHHIGTSCESGMSVGNTWSVNFCVNEFERTCLNPVGMSLSSNSLFLTKIYAPMCFPLMEAEQEVPI